VEYAGLNIWDWNGTIQDDMHHIYECGVQRIFRHFGLPCPTLEEYRHEVAADFMSSFYWPRGVPRNQTADDLNAIMAAGFKEKGAPPPVFPDALGVVRELRDRGYRQVLASGYATAKLLPAVERHGFAPYFDKVIGDVKDKGAVFSALKAEFSPDSNLVTVIGDTDEDLLGAAAVPGGAVAIICTRGFHPVERIIAARDKLERKSVILVDNLGQVLDLLY
jgi:phosphoglycolate phosphatase-like HAD superfamily hydrolase